MTLPIRRGELLDRWSVVGIGVVGKMSSNETEGGRGTFMNPRATRLKWQFYYFLN